MGEKRTYHRRDQRRTDPPRVTLTPQNKAIIEAIYLRRALTQEQITDLVFNGQGKAYTPKRLKLLYHNAYLFRRFLPNPYGLVASKIVYMLDEAGARALRKQYPVVRWNTDHNKLTAGFLEHTLTVTDVEIAFRRAARALGYSLTEWVGENAYKTTYDRISIFGKDKPQAVQPDMSLVIANPHNLTNATKRLLFEIDRGTEARTKFAAKIPAYIAYFASLECKRRFGANRITILIIALSERRLKNLKHYVEQAGGQRRFWFATLDDTKQSNPLSSPIWQIAGQTGKFSLIDLEREEERKGITKLAIPFLRTVSNHWQASHVTAAEGVSANGNKTHEKFAEATNRLI